MEKKSLKKMLLISVFGVVASGSAIKKRRLNGIPELCLEFNPELARLVKRNKRSQEKMCSHFRGRFIYKPQKSAKNVILSCKLCVTLHEGGANRQQDFHEIFL